MTIGVPKETREGETRVALVPEVAKELSGAGFSVVIQSAAGDKAFFSDPEYRSAGATVVPFLQEVYNQSDIVVKVNPPGMDPDSGREELSMLRQGQVLVGFLSPATRKDDLLGYLERNVTTFAMELIPRITRAQSMDALSSMSTIAGYKAVLLATQFFGKFFPLLMTAAGTVPPANVFVLGAGVAGLQAIATAKRLGARVEAFDVRASVKEQVESLGARFVEMELPEGVETAEGYAREVPEDFLRREMEAIGSRLPRTDVVITTAQVFGRRAPILLTKEMVQQMRPGSVIIDLAAEQGGNCEVTKPGEVVTLNGVTIYGPINVPATMPVHASLMYSRNVASLLKHLYSGEGRALDFDDEITRSTCMTHDGHVVSDVVKKLYPDLG